MRRHIHAIGTYDQVSNNLLAGLKLNNASVRVTALNNAFSTNNNWAVVWSFSCCSLFESIM